MTLFSWFCVTSVHSTNNKCKDRLWLFHELWFIIYLFYLHLYFFSGQTLTAPDTWQLTVLFICCCHLWPLQSRCLQRRFVLFIALNQSFSFSPAACVTSPFFEVSTTVVLFNSNSVGDSSCYPERGQVCGSQPEAVSNCLPVWHRPRVNVALNKCERVCVCEREKPMAALIANPLLPFNPANPKLQTVCRLFSSDLKKAGSSSGGSLKIRRKKRNLRAVDSNIVQHGICFKLS